MKQAITVCADLMEGVMQAAHAPPNPYLDRPRPQRTPPVHNLHRSANIVLIVALTMLGLLAIASLGGLAWYLPDMLERQKIEARMGPKANLAPLPAMKVEMGGVGGLSMDLTLIVELERGVKPAAIEPYIDRISDRMGDRLRDAGLERLNGAEGAKLVKEMARSVIQQEVKKIKIRDVLIEKMILRTPYGDAGEYASALQRKA
jgi:flagellar protein FliL